MRDKLRVIAAELLRSSAVEFRFSPFVPKQRSRIISNRSPSDGLREERIASSDNYADSNVRTITTNLPRNNLLVNRFDHHESKNRLMERDLETQAFFRNQYSHVMMHVRASLDHQF